MGLGRRCAPLILVLIAAAWFSALEQGLGPGPLVGALVSTGLAAALLVIARPALPAPREILLPQRPRDECAEFQRELRHLCTALKLSIRFCERHSEAEIDLLLQEVEEMGDNIRAFADRLARPVRFLPRVGCAADPLRPRSPAP